MAVAVSGLSLSEWPMDMSTRSSISLPHLALPLTGLWSKKAMREVVITSKKPGLAGRGLGVWVCVYIHTNVCLCPHVPVCVHAWVSVPKCVHTWEWVSVPVWIHVYGSMYPCVCIGVCVCVSRNVGLCALQTCPLGYQPEQRDP